MANQNKKKLVIIGAGPGGYSAAMHAKKHGLDVTLVEKQRIGGTYTNWGCIPSKALLKSASLYEQINRAGAFGINTENSSPDLEEMINRSRGIADRAASGIEFQLKQKNVKQIIGSATIKSPHQVEIITDKETKVLDTDFILIATGAHPKEIPNVPIDKQNIITYKEAIHLKTLPNRILIVGGGVLALEFAYYFRALGAEVVVVESKPHILSRHDADVVETIQKCFHRRNIVFENNARVRQVKKLAQGLNITYSTPAGTKQRIADVVLVCIGVQPSIAQFDLNSLGVQYQKSGITVNSNYQTTVDSIYAVGDVTGAPWTANAATAQAIHAVEHMAGQAPNVLKMNQIPACAYFHPPLAHVGFTENQAIAEGIQYKIGKATFKANDQALTNGDTDGLVKLMFEAKYGGLIGATIIGAAASEMIHQLSFAMRMEATMDELSSSNYLEPSLSLAIQQAAQNAQRV